MTTKLADSLRVLMSVTDELRSIEADFPATYAAVFYFVAHFEQRNRVGPSVGEIADGVGLSRPAVSRIAQALSDRRLGRSRGNEKRPEAGRKPLGLLERGSDEVDQRVKRITVSAKGRKLLSSLSAHMTAR